MGARGRFLLLAMVTIVLGLIVHWSSVPIQPDVRDVMGDALWASMMMWLVSALVPDARLSARMVMALGICFAVEASQLIHTPLLDAARRTTLGQLVLGSGFDPRDLVAYTVGVLVVAFLIARRLKP